MIKPSAYEEKIQTLEGKLETLKPVLDRLQTELIEVKHQRDSLLDHVDKIKSACERQRLATAFWQAKFATVKHENNKLRRRLGKKPDGQ